MEDPPSNQRGRKPQRDQPIERSRSRSRSRRNCAPSWQGSSHDNHNLCVPRNQRQNQACWWWEEVQDAKGIAWRKKLFWYATILSAENLASKRPRCPGREVSPARSSPSPQTMSPKARPLLPPPPPAPSAGTDASALRSRPTTSYAETTAYTTAEDALETRAKSAGKRAHAESKKLVVNGMQDAPPPSLRDNPAKAGSVAPQMHPPPLPAASSNSHPDARSSHPIRAQPSSSIQAAKAAQQRSSSSSKPSSTDEAAPATNDDEGRYPRWVRNVHIVLDQLDNNIAIDLSPPEHPDEKD